MPRTSSKRATARPLSFESTNTWIGSPSRVAICTARLAPTREPGDPSNASTIGPASCADAGTTSEVLLVLRITPLAIEPISAGLRNPADWPSRPITVTSADWPRSTILSSAKPLPDSAEHSIPSADAFFANREHTASARWRRYCASGSGEGGDTPSPSSEKPCVKRSSTTEMQSSRPFIRDASAVPKRSALAAGSDPSVATRIVEIIRFSASALGEPPPERSSPNHAQCALHPACLSRRVRKPEQLGAAADAIDHDRFRVAHAEQALLSVD